MTKMHRSRLVVASLAAVAVLGSAAAASASPGAQEDVEDRVREYEPRIRPLTVRSESLDGAERDERTDTERTVTLDADVLFEFDSDELDSEAKSRLDDLVADLEELGSRTVTISGHTDNQGDTTYNQDLSERRAESVHTALSDSLGSGFDFDVTGYGETEPVAENDTDEGQARNRRVEIQFPTD